MKNKCFLLLVLIFISCQTLISSNLKIYDAPSGAILNDKFHISVRINGNKEWKDIPAYMIYVDEVVNAKHYVRNSSMATFDFEGSVEVKVVCKNEKIDRARIRPLSYSINHRLLNDSTLVFGLDKSANLSVEVNDDIFGNLQLFANPIDKYNITKSSKDIIYFGPGIHEFKDNVYKIESGKTVYISGGAVMKGQMLIENAHDVKLIGRGIIDPKIKMGIRIANSKNVYVEGLFATQCATGGSENVTIKNVKVISYYGWGDGMNVFSSKDVTFDGVFCRNSDDCTTVYGTRLGFEGPSSNITMKNSTLWADVAHPIFIGIHGNPDVPEVLENLNYINIDILDHKEKQINYQGCLAINVGDENLVRNVRFENIRIEDFRQGQLVNLRIFYNKKYCKAPGRGIENVLFKNISYNGKNAEISIIEGYNEERSIRNVIFENLKMNGEMIYDDMPNKPKWYNTGDMAGVYIGPHVDGVSFIKTIQ